MFPSFSSKNFHQICDDLASADNDLMQILQRFGYPHLWTRPNTFETLVHIILEQQVSLASAMAALNKLREKIKIITPENILLLTDAELKGCYFSRQKIVYVKHLSQAVISGQINFAAIKKLPDDEVRLILSRLKGVGNWTIDIYLICALRRANIFPAGDLAAVNALKQLKKLPKEISREQVLQIADSWHPYRSVAAMLLWHYYLSLRRPPARKGE